ncbi:hypothetical protein RJ640_008396 [Escallonia rubra]|uniref:Disease resistance protein RGA3 n=1 Tax=Escallonia rubra TaxID=112253 RepID=A0AA88R1W3_9ASTE|nr:hypothetical protein RJ640_008396 [Escallonia rubra]
MSDALIGVVLTQLATVLDQQIRQQVKLVTGVDKEIQTLKTKLESIQAVLTDAEKRQIKEESVKLWLDKLKNASYDIDDVLTDWATAVLQLQIERSGDGAENTGKKKVISFYVYLPCFCFSEVKLRRDIAIRIREMTEHLNVIATEKDSYKFYLSTGGEEPERPRSTSFINISEIRGREEDKDTLISKLLSSDGGLSVISVVGMGGIGKTTLAQLAYHCDEVTSHFKEIIWVCVSEPFEQVRVAKAIVEKLEGDAPNLAELESVLCRISTFIAEKRFLLVLDDVWTEDQSKWEPFLNALRSGASGSKILVTARNEKIAKMMSSAYTIRLGQLSRPDCWSLFSQIAFYGRSEEECEQLEDIGRKIADKCKGLPLAAKTIGSLMRFKNTAQAWQDVLDSDIWEWEEAARGLLPSLLLSYYDLPPELKRCFLYCANFPKDYKIEADILVKLWMAHGYLNTVASVEMEVTGGKYLENLVLRSFFQEVEKDKDTDNIVRFKMHDIVHDFAQFLTKNECSIMEADRGTARRADTTSTPVRHLTLIRGEDVPFPASVGNSEKLHSFWVQSFFDCLPIVSVFDSAPPDLFCRLKYVKTLDLSRNRLRELPMEVGELMNLRYLNLSHNLLLELPETVCDLCNLQTLKLVACDHLKRLPQGIGKLISLRHLEIDRTESLKVLPTGIKRLSSLRTLSKFVIGSGVDAGEAACNIGDLKELNHLRGCLRIEGLGNVVDACEAEKAELKNKKHLSDLHLSFNPLTKADGTTKVVKALQLHPNLQFLQMKSYGGTEFPAWIISLTNLKKLRLLDCQGCTGLPPLGKLPSLETLYIEHMQDLKCVTGEFLGIDIGNNDGGITSTKGRAGVSSSAISAFPKLKKLTVSNMRNWEEWDVTVTGGAAGEAAIRIMPCLRYLKLSHCNKLKMLPQPLLQMTPLNKLRIHSCPLLQQRYQKERGEDWMKISHIPKSRIS